MSNEKVGSEARELGKKLARRAGKLIKAAEPQARRLAEEARPHAEAASQEAARFAKEHQREIKLVGMTLMRSRLTGPLGMVVGSLINDSPQPTDKRHRVCPGCRTENPLAANFCNQCGTALPPA